jgi:hypothetical protein
MSLDSSVVARRKASLQLSFSFIHPSSGVHPAIAYTLSPSEEKRNLKNDFSYLFSVLKWMADGPGLNGMWVKLFSLGETELCPVWRISG